MSSSQFTFTIYLLTFALFLQTIFGAIPVFHYCLSSAGNFTSDDPYGSNLYVLLGNLYNQTPPQGFGLGSVGLNPYQIYGLALCRRDVEQTIKRSNSHTPELYAGELLDFAGGDSKKLFGMVQCTRDLSCNNCFKCLDSIIAKLPSCCNGKVGGKVGAGSCNIRCEMSPFFSF